MPTVRLKVLNLDTARFKCVYPSCGGICCRGSRPPIDPGEADRITENVKKFLPHLRANARRVVERNEYRTKRMKEGRQTLAVVDQYCVFYNDGCILHKVGAAEGDKNKYKPGTCITFPLDETARGDWYIRQWGVEGEEWDLPCLDPNATTQLAKDTMADELEYAKRLESGKEAWRAG